MVVLHDFTPCVDDELEVKRGQIVNVLYRENDWVYIIGQDNRQEGFIPHSYCAPYNTHLADLAIKKKLPRGTLPGVENQISDYSESHQSNDIGLQNNLQHSQASLNSEADFFAKDPSGRYIVLYTFIARDENDVSVERGEFVTGVIISKPSLKILISLENLLTVLNKEDPDWYWIVRSDGQEGFIPSAFVYPAENILQTQEMLASNSTVNVQSTTQTNGNNNVGGNLMSLSAPQIVPTAVVTTNEVNFMATGPLNNNQTCQQQPAAAQIVQAGQDDLRYHGTELVMLYDYKAQAPDDLSVRRGEWIYADLNNQTVDGWLWAYLPKANKKSGKYGFIPKAYTQPFNRQNTSV